MKTIKDITKKYKALLDEEIALCEQDERNAAKLELIDAIQKIEDMQSLWLIQAFVSGVMESEQ